MNTEPLSRRPYVLEPNRVERFFTGGRLLDKWQGLPEREDSNWSEELLVTTTEYIGPSKEVKHQGLSRTILEDGSEILLRDLIAGNETIFLGSEYAGKTDGQAGVLARVGDSTVRLVLQFHPDQEGARRHLGFHRGKTEAWYILNTRTIDGVEPYVLVGNRPGVTREEWTRAFESQDVEAMCGFMYRIPVKKGDVILVPAGIPHAMGSGCVFLEIHEACDYTFRLEKEFLGRTIDPEQMHYGIGFDAMLDLIHYDNWTEDEVRNKAVMTRTPVEKADSGIRYNLIDYGNTPDFAMDVVELSGRFTLPESDSHYLVITTSGDTTLTCPGGTLKVPQGRGVFVPADVESLTAEGRGEIVIAYPYRA